MIELNTGVPGSGKTLSMVARLHKVQARWESHPDESRSVFVLGIPDLLLPHSPVPLKSVQVSKIGAPMLVPDWDSMPDGSLVIIDEAQGCFPPRSSVSQAPEHVAWLNVHRHRGFDIWLTTQHPKLIDGSVRALVGKHQHYRRMFGGSRAVCYEWDACSDSLSGMKNAVKTYFRYPRSTFKFYKSAEVHTKQHFKIPLWVFIPFIGIALGLYFVPRSYQVLSHGVKGEGIKIDEPATPSKPISRGLASAGEVVPASSTSSSSVPPPAVSDLVQISACIATATRCQCYNHHGIHLPMSDQACRASAAAPNDKFRLQEPGYQPQQLAAR